ncbi:MAG: DUF2298 domain-containing protein [Candidatus Methanoperedens sp.]|nr:DUF2298 domain-containing protein [Candidatus Methanoperedens sp.]
MISELFHIAVWYLIILFLGIAALPITSFVCKNLPDRGYSVSKILGILIFAYISWVLSYLVGYSIYVIAVSLSFLCIVSAYIYVKARPHIDRNLLLTGELIFGSVFLFFLTIRAFNPDISGGEKAGDFMILNSILRSSSLPPIDAWLSGFNINTYYYFGLYTLATLTKLTGIPAYITFNLGMALIPALAANAVFGIGYNLTRNRKAGAMALFLLVFAGNLYPASVIAFHALNITSTPWGTSPGIVDYWGPSRVIPYTINEFPYFSFIFGDLHAHVIAMPFVLLAIMLILNFYLAEKISLSALVFLSLSIGALFLFNSWDYPVYVVFLFLVLIIRPIYTRKQIFTDFFKRWGTCVLVISLSLLMFIIYFMDFRPAGVLGIKPVTIRTELFNFLVIYNLFLFLIFSFMLLNLPAFKYKKQILAAVFLLAAALYFFPNFQTLTVFVPLGILISLNVYNFHRNKDLQRLFVSMLILTGFLILVFCELLYFVDLYGSPWERMNTVFKYYIQVWLLWSIASAFAFFDLSEKKYRMKNLVMAAVVLLAALNSIYLITGTGAKTYGFARSPTIDGIDFMKKGNYGKYDALIWVYQNIHGAPVVLEAPGTSYGDYSPISSYAGLPTVVGWVSHELVWRNNWVILSQRIADVDTIYDSTDLPAAYSLLKKYNVSYVYIGDIESNKYKAEGLKKFEDTSHFEHVYRGYADIYRVVNSTG